MNARQRKLDFETVPVTGTFETSSDFRAMFDHLKPQDQQLFVRKILQNFEDAGERLPFVLDNFLNLPPLTQAKAFDTKHPHSGFASHRAESLKGQGRSLGMPENIATGSSANYNYASVQKDNQHWDNHRQIERQKVETADLIPTFRHFLSLASALDSNLSAILHGKVSPVIPTFYWKEEPHADPVKQVTAWKMLLDMRVLSHSDVMMLCGKNPDCQKLIVKEDLDEMKDYMIPVDVPAFASEETDERPSQRP